MCHAKIARFCRPTKSPDFVGQNRACSIFDDFVGRLFVYRTTNFVYVAMVIVYNRRRIFILVIYCVCYLFSFIRCRNKSHASIILRSAFGCCASRYCTKQQMKISAVCHGSPILSANFFGQLNHAHKSRPTLSFI